MGILIIFSISLASYLVLFDLFFILERILGLLTSSLLHTLYNFFIIELKG